MEDKRQTEAPSDDWKKDWEEILLAAAAGRFPNRALGVIDAAECVCQLRKSRVVPDSQPR
jgi:hypothetical protein